jgi:membrane protein involved in colicin uptake
MAAVTDGAWVQEAVELRAQGKSWVEVAQAVGKPRSTVQDAVKRADEAVLEDVYGSGDPGEQIPDPIPGQTCRTSRAGSSRSTTAAGRASMS